MHFKLLAALPALAVLTACGSIENALEDIRDEARAIASEEAPATVVIPTGAAAGSVTLAAGQTAQSSSLQELNAIDFSASEVGAIVEINEGDYESLTIKKTGSVAGKDSIEISVPSTTILQTAAVGSIQDWLAAVTSFEDDDGEPGDGSLSHTSNGRNFYNYSTTYERGTTSLTEARVIYSENDRTVKATVEYGAIAGRPYLAIGATRDNEANLNDSYLSTQGEYSYRGSATVFAEDPSYTSNNATMEVNFDTNQGSFSATEFTGDEGAANKDISISTNVIVDNVAGTISSSSGTIRVGDVEKNVGLNGVLAHNNNAVVGGIISSESADGIIGGIFSLSKDP